MTFGLWVLAAVFLLAAGMGAPMGLAMLAAGFAYLAATHQDLGLVVDQTMNGLYNNYLLLAIPLFIFVANLMNASGVLERLLGFAQAMVGRVRGGLAHVNLVTNLIFTGMSGSAVADAAGPGLIVARMMTRDERYPRGFAAATSAVAATLGPLVPPSIPMIFYALIANVSVGALFLAGTVPALATAAALMGAIALIARRRNFPSEPPPPWNAIGPIFVRALPPLALPVILLGIIYSGIATPTEAAAIAAAYALILALVIYRSITLRALVMAVSETVAQTASIGLIMSGAFVFNYAVANENVPQLLRNTLVGWHLSPTGFLLCINALLFLLAIVIDEITILLVIVPLLVPVAEALHIDLVHFGVVIMLNMMIGLALPPHGLLLFVISNLTATSLADIFREVPIFIVTMIAMLLLVTFVPDLVLWLPRLVGFSK
ncbi:MAG: TRAP transporter large permease [Xanthobacteraceae bacterium]